MNTFGQPIPIRDVETGEVIGSRPAVVSRITRNELGGQFGSDKRRRMVVSMVDGDLIALRPHGSRRTVTLEAVEVYRYAIRCQVNAVERRAKEYRKSHGGRMATARNVARKELGL